MKTEVRPGVVDGEPAAITTSIGEPLPEHDIEHCVDRATAMLADNCPTRPLYGSYEGGPRVFVVDHQCGKTLECGGSCWLHTGHSGVCSCVGDYPGERGTCPA